MALKRTAVPTKKQQFHTVDELIAKSQPSFTYYFLLFVSSLIITSGLLLSNSAIVIGGMIVTPVLTPIIAIALAITVGRGELLRRMSFFLLKSFGFIVFSGFLLRFIFGQPPQDFFFADTMRTAVLYFIVALCSGAAATFAFAHRNSSDILPGIAVAVSLVPPLSLIGIGLAGTGFALSRFFLLVFFMNTIGIVFGGIVTFSFMRFYRAESKVDEELKALKKKDKQK
ncbi:MAG: DUF389 domain-containing protein [Candidatus Paceibacterota bacterium]